MVCRAPLETLDFPESKDESTNMAKTVHRMRPPTPFELEILKIVWELKTATVRDIYETLREQRRIAYTTVMTMMKIMEGKGQLKKSQAGRPYVYKATHARERVIKEMVREFVDRVFNGAPEALLTHLIEDSDLSLEEQKKIKGIITTATLPAG